MLIAKKQLAWLNRERLHPATRAGLAERRARSAQSCRIAAPEDTLVLDSFFLYFFYWDDTFWMEYGPVW